MEKPLKGSVSELSAEIDKTLFLLAIKYSAKRGIDIEDVRGLIRYILQENYSAASGK